MLNNVFIRVNSSSLQLIKVVNKVIKSVVLENIGVTDVFVIIEIHQRIMLSVAVVRVSIYMFLLI